MINLLNNIYKAPLMWPLARFLKYKDSTNLGPWISKSLDLTTKGLTT